MSKVDITPEAVERVWEEFEISTRSIGTENDMDIYDVNGLTDAGYDLKAIVDAQAERIEELEGDKAAGLRREKDANERAMQHLRRAEKAEIASKNHAAFSHEWRKRAEKAEAENGILRTEKHADAEAIGTLRDDLARFREDRSFVIGWNDGFAFGVNEAAQVCKPTDFNDSDEVRVWEYVKHRILALIEGDTHD